MNEDNNEIQTRDKEVPTWQKITATSLGGIFLVVSLFIALFIPNPTTFQIFVFRVTLSVAGAGFGAIIPGLIKVNVNNWVKAGGALALFVLIYQINPPALITEPVETSEPKQEEVQKN